MGQRAADRAGLIILGVVGWTWFALSWSYSEGERAGILQKFSRKGWICKTYEGELALYVVGGVAPQIWHFSTRDEKVASSCRRAVGQNIRAALHRTSRRADQLFRRNALLCRKLHRGGSSPSAVPRCTQESCVDDHRL